MDYSINDFSFMPKCLEYIKRNFPEYYTAYFWYHLNQEVRKTFEFLEIDFDNIQDYDSIVLFFLQYTFKNNFNKIKSKKNNNKYHKMIIATKVIAEDIDLLISNSICKLI